VNGKGFNIILLKAMLDELLSNADDVKRERMMAVLLQMKKLYIITLNLRKKKT
jgi:hypothetical protein